MNNYDVIIVGAGFAGATMAERFHQAGKKALIIEQRSHIGGNMYDFIDDNKVLRHEYGPHIFHTASKVAVEYLSSFTEWFDYEHRVIGEVDEQLVPIPFNLKSIELCFDEEKATRLKDILIKSYGMETKVPILTLKANENEEIKELAEYIYEKVFKYYTMKQWGLKPEEIDPGVTARVPVFVSFDDRYFQDAYQVMPKAGYTKIFERMLENTEVLLNTKCQDLIKLDGGKVFFNGVEFKGILIYTGAVDELLDYKYGPLPYRSLDFVIETHDGQYQPTTTVNYPTPEKEHSYTRITEYKLMMNDIPQEKTTIAIEYPKAYDYQSEDIPYYPIFTDENQIQYNQYVEELKQYKNFHLLGRLAEYRYYNMDAIILRSLQMYGNIK